MDGRDNPHDLRARHEQERVAMKRVKATELGIPELYIAWIKRSASGRWMEWESLFRNLDDAINFVSGIQDLRAIVVSTSTGLVVWDSEERK